MNMRRLALASMAVMASAFIAVGANAATIGPIGPDSPLVILSYPDDAFGGGSIRTGNTSFTHTYEFQLGNSAGSLNSLAFVGSVGSGFTSLSVSLVEAIIGGSTIASANALTLATPVVVSGLVSGGLYNLIFSGTTASGGNSVYAFNVSAVPVPPALLLLVSGLFGAGFMGRRKMGSKKVSV
jgi:hypothetical protein